MIKKTLDYKATLDTVKMPRKCIAMPTIDIIQLIVNQRQRKWVIACINSSSCGCLYRSLKLLTDGQVTLQRFNSKHIILRCVI